MSLQQLANTVGGRLVGESVHVHSISTDTRTISEGDLFVALQGENFDGNEFAQQAIEKGALAALLSDDINLSAPYIKVSNTLDALTDLARAERIEADIPVVAITGSNGKTSVKEMLASILRQSKCVLATEGNLNNQIGVPLTLLKLTDAYDVAVVEMGASRHGDIAHLCSVAAPTVVILNNVGSAHLEGFGDLQGVANAKGEIVSGVSEAGVVVLNKEEPWFDQWVALAGDKRVVSFGWSNSADIWVDRNTIKTGLFAGEFKTSFVMNVQQQNIDVQLNLIGEHNVLNALAAAAAAISLGASADNVRDGLALLQSVKGRMQALKGLNDSVIINDCYNANPKSFDAAMACLTGLDEPVWLVLGDFAELGVESGHFHAQIGESIANSRVQRIFAVGSQMKLAVDSFDQHVQSDKRLAQHFSNKAEMANALVKELGEGLVVLVKGSRSQGLENVVERITKNEGVSCC